MIIFFPYVSISEGMGIIFLSTSSYQVSLGSMATPFNEDPIFKRVKSTLISGSGMEGLKTTVKVFRQFDSNNDNELDPSEWRAGLAKLGVKLTDAEANYLFIAFDVNKDGLISIDEFVRNLIGQLNPRRTRVVDKAFQKFQEEGNPNATHSPLASKATVTCNQLTSTFDARTNPLVKSGAKSEAQLIREFAAIFDESRNPSGAITKEEFKAYYAALSTTVPFDDIFEAMVIQTWGIDDTSAPRLGSTLREWGPEGDPLQVEKPLLKTQALNNTLSNTNTTKAYNASHMTRQHPPFVPNPSVQPDYISITKNDYIPYEEQQRLRGDPMGTRRGNDLYQNSPVVERAMATASSKPFKATGNPVIDGLRKKILEKSDEEGFCGLRRSFLVMDMPNNKILQKQEARAGLQRFKVSVTPIEFEQLWNYICRNADGDVTVSEFVRQIRGDESVNERRYNAIREAFEYLDAKGSGSLRIATIAPLINLSDHPLVRKGTKSVDQVLQDFIDAWDKNRDGSISWEEWLTYYSDLSAGIEDDQYFELMIQNTWRIKRNSNSGTSASGVRGTMRS